jgi:hypothetical protein
MVQSARVPSIREINPRVSAEVERVLMKALTEDPDARYQKARDFGKALNQLLFTAGRSVSSFEIAELVEPIRKEREHKRRIQKRQSIIGTLIDEAMLEFTSIDTGTDRASNTGGGSVVGSMPVEIAGLNNPNPWGEDFANMGLQRQRQPESSGDSFEIGNLAALEDDPLSGSMRSAPPLSGLEDDDSEPPPQVAPLPPVPKVPKAPPMASVADDEPPPNMKGGKGGVVAAVVVILLLAAGAGAYFGGFIPH